VSGRSAVVVNAELSIPLHELTFRATRAGGPGGQHVNTSSTRVELVWNLDRSRAVTDDQRARVREKLASRVDGQGNVRVVASAHRSQLRNRDDALDRLAALLRRALAVPKSRKKTRPGRGAVESRLESKRRHRAKKEQRRLRDDD
jgi:ribosome-associated protein